MTRDVEAGEEITFDYKFERFGAVRSRTHTHAHTRAHAHAPIRLPLSHAFPASARPSCKSATAEPPPAAASSAPCAKTTAWTSTFPTASAAFAPYARPAAYPPPPFPPLIHLPAFARGNRHRAPAAGCRTRRPCSGGMLPPRRARTGSWPIASPGSTSGAAWVHAPRTGHGAYGSSSPGTRRGGWPPTSRARTPCSAVSRCAQRAGSGGGALQRIPAGSPCLPRLRSCEGRGQRGMASS